MSIRINVVPPRTPPPTNPGPVILVVDDEGLIRDLLDRILRLHGFRCLIARNGHEAIALYQEKHAEVALVLLDIQMPGMGGPETLTALRAINASVRCCFMSGDLGNYSLEELNACGAQSLLAKPFRGEDLIATLRILTGASPA